MRGSRNWGRFVQPPLIILPARPHTRLTDTASGPRQTPHLGCWVGRHVERDVAVDVRTGRAAAPADDGGPAGVLDDLRAERTHLGRLAVPGAAARDDARLHTQPAVRPVVHAAHERIQVRPALPPLAHAAHPALSHKSFLHLLFNSMALASFGTCLCSRPACAHTLSGAQGPRRRRT